MGVLETVGSANAEAEASREWANFMDFGATNGGEQVGSLRHKPVEIGNRAVRAETASDPAAATPEAQSASTDTATTDYEDMLELYAQAVADQGAGQYRSAA